MDPRTPSLIALSRALLTALLVVAFSMAGQTTAQQPAEVLPYLQNPGRTTMTIQWFNQQEQWDTIEVAGVGRFRSIVDEVPALAYSAAEITRFFEDQDPGTPYRHRVRVSGLRPGQSYQYRRESDGFTATLRALPADGSLQPVRFVVYADSETEPESTGKPGRWARPGDHTPEGLNRPYIVDQTEGYRANLAIMAERNPLFIAIAGDLVESGGEQRDWDEFWRHNAGEYNNLASRIPILPAVGNHENHQGLGAPVFYSVPGAIAAVAKYRTYFETPDNGSQRPEHDSRYYSVEIGPIKFITIDTSAGQPHRSEKDTNWYLFGDDEPDGRGNAGEAPDFNPGSRQYAWLEEQLADGQRRFAFTFVQFHHAPYSVGPHGLPPGDGDGLDTQSGVPARVLTPLFKQYGVAAVFSGHDEMYQHSMVDGIHFYDIGIGGDDLRGPVTGEDGSSGRPTTNPHQVFLAHLDAPEVWDGKRLVSGGKHYGHLEVNVARDDAGYWVAVIEPVYAFPIMNDQGEVTGWERRVYDDRVTIRR